MTLLDSMQAALLINQRNTAADSSLTTRWVPCRLETRQIKIVAARLMASSGQEVKLQCPGWHAYQAAGIRPDQRHSLVTAARQHHLDLAYEDGNRLLDARDAPDAKKVGIFERLRLIDVLQGRVCHPYGRPYRVDRPRRAPDKAQKYRALLHKQQGHESQA